jgi:hypothetical protein
LNPHPPGRPPSRPHERGLASLASLKIRFTDYNKTFDADHWQIESVAGTMAMDALKGALDNPARSAIVRLVALGQVTAPSKV